MVFDTTLEQYVQKEISNGFRNLFIEIFSVGNDNNPRILNALIFNQSFYEHHHG